MGFDIVYQFDVGGGRTATSVTWTGRLNGGNDEATIQVYNGSGWDTIYTIDGKSGTADDTVSLALLATHTGTGSDLGKVWIRFVTSGQTGPTLYTDQLLVQAVNIGQTAGYAGGYIYFDSDASNTNTEAFVDGTADRPVSTWAAVKTLQSSTGLTRVDVTGSLTLDSSAEVFDTMRGRRATLALGGQDIGDVPDHEYESGERNRNNFRQPPSV